jgi:hypothetical protein
LNAHTSQPRSDAKTHIMVDLETMGTRPGSVIASIGAVVFDPVEGTLGSQFYRTISLPSAAAAGLLFDGQTVKFWLNQSDAARAALFRDEGELSNVLIAFAEFWKGQRGEVFWSHGANFDEPVLGAAFHAVKLRTPWSYSASRCTRTIYDLAGVKPDRAAGTHHDALDDAIAQALAVCRAYDKLGLSRAAPGARR